MNSDKPKVLYILGSGRNGSTVLGNVLGSAPGLAHVGELHWIWDRGVGENRPCGCGKQFSDCSFWQGTLEDMDAVEPAAAGDREGLRAATLEGLAPRRLLRRRPAKPLPSKQRAYLDLTERLYRTIAEEAGVGIIVDSSKRPVYGLAVRRIEGVDTYVVHLVRDARAVSFSWRRKKVNPDRPDGGYMPQYAAWKSAAGWAVWNALGELMRWRDRERFLRVKYEDFVHDPAPTLAAIGDLIGADLSSLASPGGHVEIGENHTISGNPSKFVKGAVRLREDAEWVTAMEPKDFWVTTLVTWPLLLYFRYPLRRKRWRRAESRP